MNQNQNNLISAKDIFKKLSADLSPTKGSITLDMALSFGIALVAALAAGLLIYFVYRKFFRGAVFSQSFAITLVGLAVLSCTITLAISSNLVISLGMVGALSIVRYRTAIKEPVDLLFLFWAITAGITVGAKLYLLVAAASVVLILILLFLNRGGLHQAYIMIVHYEGEDIADALRRILSKTRHNIKSRTIRGNSCEMAVEVYARRENLAFLQQVRELKNVNDVTLVQYNGEYHG